MDSCVRAHQALEGVIKVLDGKANVRVAHAGLVLLGTLPLYVHLDGKQTYLSASS